MKHNWCTDRAVIDSARERQGREERRFKHNFSGSHSSLRQKIYAQNVRKFMSKTAKGQSRFLNKHSLLKHKNISQQSALTLVLAFVFVCINTAVIEMVEFCVPSSCVLITVLKEGINGWINGMLKLLLNKDCYSIQILILLKFVLAF